MESLCGSDQVDRAVRQAARLGRGDAVFDARVRGGVGELLRARIGRHHAVEVFGETDRGLAVAGAGVERDPVLARQTGDGGDEVARIARAAGGVGGGVTGEMIFEAHKFLIKKARSLKSGFRVAHGHRAAPPGAIQDGTGVLRSAPPHDCHRV